jgi:hypothetical protein
LPMIGPPSRHSPMHVIAWLQDVRGRRSAVGMSSFTRRF